LTIVLGAGRTPCPIMFIGEAPGEVEAREREPFVGPSGQEQDRYLSQFGFVVRMFYRTNLIKEYTPGNPDPTPSQISQWRDTLRYEIAMCQPGLIVTVGAFATWEFLRTSMADKPEPYFLTGKVHGIPHYVSPLSPHCDILAKVVILPIIHPAAGMRPTDDAMVLRSSIFWDYSQVARCINLTLSNSPIDVPVDIHAGNEDYRVISPAELPSYLPYDTPDFALDTEGTPDNPFSVQISCKPGTGYMLLCDDPAYHTIAAPYIQSLLDRGTLVYTHSRYEIEMSRAISLNFSRANLLDTMYAAYLLLTEPQGLKALCHRWCGMAMTDHDDTIKPLGVERQLAYLESIIERKSEWPIPGKRHIVENDGTIISYKPQPIHKYAAGILRDYRSGKVDKDGNTTNLEKRWKKIGDAYRGIDKELKGPVESVLGKFPHGSIRALYDKDRDAAIYYSCRDPHGTYMFAHAITPRLKLFHEQK